MEDHYWWHNTNLKALEEGKFHIRDEKLEEMIGGLIFSYPEWQGPGLRVKGSKGGSTEVYQVARNCGNLQMGAIYPIVPESIAMQDFITRNIASVTGYNVINASCPPQHADKLVALNTGWKKYLEFPANRTVGSPMAFVVCSIPPKDMKLVGYAFSQDRFYPKQMGEKKAGARQW
jgi:hypothetical protein